MLDLICHGKRTGAKLKDINKWRENILMAMGRDNEDEKMNFYISIFLQELNSDAIGDDCY